MITVGIRELKSKLSAYLRQVRDGELVVVTDRGAPVAEIRPSGDSEGPTEYALLNRLIREGHVRSAIPVPPEETFDVDPIPELRGATVLELLDASRDDR